MRIRPIDCLLFCLACTAGCTHAPTPAGGIPLLSTNASEKPATLDDRQAADVQIALARGIEKQGNHDQAIAAYKQAIQRDPHRSDAMLRLAIMHDRQGKFKESGSYYEKALKESKGAADIHCNYGYSLYLQRRWADAEQHLREAIAKSSDCAQAHNNLALVLARSERGTDALVEFQRGGSSPAEAHANLAYVLTLEGRWEEARQAYGRALAVNPSLEAAREGLKKLDTLAAYEQARADAVAVSAATPSTPTPLATR